MYPLEGILLGSEGSRTAVQQAEGAKKKRWGCKTGYIPPADYFHDAALWDWKASDANEAANEDTWSSEVELSFNVIVLAVTRGRHYRQRQPARSA